MARTPIDWHHPRQQLAAGFLRMFLDVGAHAMVLFAPRGKGKTQFMMKDMIPAAAKADLFPVYVNFWDDNESPSASFIYGLVRAASEPPSGISAAIAQGLSRFHLDLEFELGPVKVAGGLAPRPQEAFIQVTDSSTDAGHTAFGGDSTLLHMRKVVDALHKHTGQDLLFIFDEVQTLALKPEHATFVRSLRTLLDERRGFVKSIFTGSSQARLTELFSSIKAPLYNFAQSVEFPELGDDFLQRWMRNVALIMGLVAQKATIEQGAAAAEKHGLRLEHMREAFAVTGRNPRVFWAAMLTMIQRNSVDILGTAREAAASVEENAGLRQRLAELPVLDRLVLTRIVIDQAARSANPSQPLPPLQLFSEAERRQWKGDLGMVPTPTQVQAALRRLSGSDLQLIVHRDRGQYGLEDPFFLGQLQAELLGVQEPVQEEAQEQEPPRELERVRG
jgi:hypothetical protein